jgi:hypothetical protein
VLDTRYFSSSGERGRQVVPVDLCLTREAHLILSGINAGGKTVGSQDPGQLSYGSKRVASAVDEGSPWTFLRMSSRYGDEQTFS